MEERAIPLAPAEMAKAVLDKGKDKQVREDAEGSGGEANCRRELRTP